MWFEATYPLSSRGMVGSIGLHLHRKQATRGRGQVLQLAIAAIPTRTSIIPGKTIRIYLICSVGKNKASQFPNVASFLPPLVSVSSQVVDPRDFVQKKRQVGDSSNTNIFDIGPHRSLKEIDLEMWQDTEEEEADGDNETSVHMRMYPIPQVHNW